MKNAIAYTGTIAFSISVAVLFGVLTTGRADSYVVPEPQPVTLDAPAPTITFVRPTDTIIEPTWGNDFSCTAHCTNDTETWCKLDECITCEVMRCNTKTEKACKMVIGSVNCSI